jgi:hypothetical protein
MQVQEKLPEMLKIFMFAVPFLLPVNARAGATPGCFDFSTRLSEPMHPPVTTDQSGNLPGDVTWAAVRGDVDHPLSQILKDLEEHRSTRSSRINKMEIRPIQDPNYLAKQEVKSEVDPFPFVSVKWTEIWGFVVTQGTAENPERVVISYEKTEGTSHIEHLCGNYVLQKKGDGNTDVFIYEEAKATGRDAKDTLQGLLGNLAAFRKPK